MAEDAFDTAWAAKKPQMEAALRAFMQEQKNVAPAPADVARAMRALAVKVDEQGQGTPEQKIADAEKQLTTMTDDMRKFRLQAAIRIGAQNPSLVPEDITEKVNAYTKGVLGKPEMDATNSSFGLKEKKEIVQEGMKAVLDMSTIPPKRTQNVASPPQAPEALPALKQPQRREQEDMQKSVWEEARKLAPGLLGTTPALPAKSPDTLPAIAPTSRNEKLVETRPPAPAKPAEKTLWEEAKEAANAGAFTPVEAGKALGEDAFKAASFLSKKLGFTK